LEAAGLAQNHRVGRESQYAFYPDQLAGRWESALIRLKSFVEDGEA
jgi:hypothetical protein